MSTTEHERLRALMERRVATLGEIETLALRRSEALDAGRTEAVSRLVETRETLVAELAASVGEVEALARSLEGVADPELLALVAKAEGILARIDDVDRRDEATIARAGGRLRTELDEVARRGRAGRAYRDASGAAPAPASRQAPTTGPGGGTPSIDGNRVEHSA